MANVRVVRGSRCGHEWAMVNGHPTLCPACNPEPPAPEPIHAKAYRLEAENARLRMRLKAAEAVCEAAASVATEEQVSDLLSCYVMGLTLNEALAAWRREK